MGTPPQSRNNGNQGTSLGTKPGALHLQVARQILNGASSVALGLVELRNSYETGHEPGSLWLGLEQRHAELAVNAARLWPDMMLATFPLKPRLGV